MTGFLLAGLTAGESTAATVCYQCSAPAPLINTKLSLLVAVLSSETLFMPAIQRGFSQYIKKRKLDPIETYIPAILQAKAQLLDVPSVAGKISVCLMRGITLESLMPLVWDEMDRRTDGFVFLVVLGF